MIESSGYLIKTATVTTKSSKETYTVAQKKPGFHFIVFLSL